MNPWTGKTVVVVDDMDHVRSDLEGMYRSLGLNVVGMAKDGLEALELIQNVNPDLVSLDIIMPEMDGVECYEKLKEFKNPPKVLFVTCLASEPKFVDSFKGRIPEELFMPKNQDESMFKARLNYIFGDGTLLDEGPSLSIHDVVNENAADPSLDVD